QDTFQIQTQRAPLDVYLADGSNIRLDIQTLDRRILEARWVLSRELIQYFSLFFFQDHDDGALSGKFCKFFLGCTYLHIMSFFSLGMEEILDPLDTALMDCRAALELLNMQVKLIEEVQRNWIKLTEVQMQELEFLSFFFFLVWFLEPIRGAQFYGYLRLDPGIRDYPEKGCSASIYVGNDEINCCIKLLTNQTEEISFKINKLRNWQITFLVSFPDGEDNALELRFEYNDSGTWE
ncbi:SNX31 protein, partial [Centropus unirufus]|nr:SNX31 protein [Centropus unirufus]